MNTIRLLDTNIVSHAMNRPDEHVARRMRQCAQGGLAINPIVAGEIRFGLVKQPSPIRERRFAQILDVLTMMPIDQRVSETYGILRADLARRGTPIGSNDMWIAAHALAAGLTLVTANEGEFLRVEGLPVENWLS